MSDSTPSVPRPPSRILFWEPLHSSPDSWLIPVPPWGVSTILPYLLPVGRAGIKACVLCTQPHIVLEACSSHLNAGAHRQCLVLRAGGASPNPHTCMGLNHRETAGYVGQSLEPPPTLLKKCSELQGVLGWAALPLSPRGSCGLDAFQRLGRPPTPPRAEGSDHSPIHSHLLAAMLPDASVRLM